MLGRYQDLARADLGGVAAPARLALDYRRRRREPTSGRLPTATLAVVAAFADGRPLAVSSRYCSSRRRLGGTAAGR